MSNIEEPINVFRKAGEFGRDPELIRTLINVLDLEIKYDYTTKLAVFFTGLSTYTDEPLNLFLRGPSSIGKTYNSTTVLRLYPKDDEGCNSPEEFIAVWNRIHPRIGYVPLQMVYVHVFQKVAEP